MFNIMFDKYGNSTEKFSKLFSKIFLKLFSKSRRSGRNPVNKSFSKSRRTGAEPRKQVRRVGAQPHGGTP